MVLMGGLNKTMYLKYLAQRKKYMLSMLLCEDDCIDNAHTKQ